MKRALINVDYTYDFVAPDGALTAGEPAQAIESSIVQLTKEFYEAGDYVALMIDVHQENDPYHPESKLFPPHNIEGTKGVELYGELDQLYQEIKEAANVEYFPKTRYSAFAGTNLAIKLWEREIREVHIVGVCTDICVLHTAIDAYNLGFEIVIHESAVATFVPGGQEWALAHFKDVLGAKIV